MTTWKAIKELDTIIILLRNLYYAAIWKDHISTLLNIYRYTMLQILISSKPTRIGLRGLVRGGMRGTGYCCVAGQCRIGKFSKA